MGDALDKVGRLIRDPGVEVDATGFTFALLVSAGIGIAMSLM